MNTTAPRTLPERNAAPPIARTFTHADLRRSLHHLMLAVDRRSMPDEKLGPRARRRFGFVCGACGARQNARVWDIASQRRCGYCGAMMIIPAPRRRPLAAGAPMVDALYCPRCGREVEHADRSRHYASYCPDCQAWF